MIEPLTCNTRDVLYRPAHPATASVWLEGRCCSSRSITVDGLGTIFLDFLALIFSNLFELVDKVLVATPRDVPNNWRLHPHLLLISTPPPTAHTSTRSTSSSPSPLGGKYRSSSNSQTPLLPIRILCPYLSQNGVSRPGETQKPSKIPFARRLSTGTDTGEIISAEPESTESSAENALTISCNGVGLSSSGCEPPAGGVGSTPRTFNGERTAKRSDVFIYM